LSRSDRCWDRISAAFDNSSDEPFEAPTVGGVMAAIFNLNHPAHTVHWHFFTMSVSNVIVIVLMLVVFAVAILAPFPRHGRGEPT
jgi:hypothetical protein